MLTVESDLVTVSLARSALYGVLAAIFRHPENPLFRSLNESVELDALRDAGALAGGNQSERLMECAHALHERAQTTDRSARVTEFIRLFGHTSRGVVPPYETEYGSGGPFSQPQEMSDISGFYNAFGLALDPVRHERFDHICCELEFMCFLCAKQAYTTEIGDNDGETEIVRTQRIFMRDHLARFGCTFFMRVKQESSGTWHGAAAELGLRYLEAECHRLNVTAQRAYLPLRPVDDFDVPMACGSCAGECATERIEE